MHVNSLAAYESGRADLFSARELAILNFLRKLQGTSASDRDVMISLGFSDMNSVRPRITELVKDGVLVESGSKTDDVTGKTVRLVALRASSPAKQHELALT